MPHKSGKTKGKSRKHKSRKRKAEFPVLSIREILNPCSRDTTHARHERQKVFRALVNNLPITIRNSDPSVPLTAIARPVPAVADCDEFLMETHGQVYHPDVKAKAKIGDENDKGKIIPARDGSRLCTLSVKKLYKIIISLNKNRKKIAISAGLAATERTQMFNQLATTELQLKAKKQQAEMATRAKQDLLQEIRHADRVYREKLKATQSEYHQTLLEAKTEHLTYFLGKHKLYWKQEKDQHEEYVATMERAEYDKYLLGCIGKQINLSELRDRQVRKEDYLMVIQTELENFELFVNDTQNEVHSAIKVHARYLDKLKQKNFDGMMTSQDKTISEMQKFFQGDNTANSNIIHQLKTDVNRRRARLDRLERDVFVALEENAKFVIPLNQMNIEVAKYEEKVAGADKVRAEHQRLWIRAKKLEEHVLQLKWRRELAVDKVEKANEKFQALQNVYTQSTMEIARKAGLAKLAHNKTYSLLEEELMQYNISHLIMQAFMGKEFKGTLYTDTRIQHYLERQEQEILHLKIGGNLLKRKYDRNRSELLNLFQSKFLRSLQSTGFHIPSLETHLDQGLLLFTGLPEEHLRDIENQPNIQLCI